ncbi:ATP-binding protein [Microlunatus speluncae]|uniref:ATP-binding protein n=1 Tax=Microlunatus speluncae TaxID=2594267 RepID=UPI00126640F2|nr:ATP-binding protein [Microlunatus speluncae]
MIGSGTDANYFDLNIEEVLEHWPVAFAIRELIANALDEQMITRTAEPEISKLDDEWRIKDFGRGVRYQHLTQNENAEKRQHDEVIGQFGMGLKDALAVFHRRGVAVTVSSSHGEITTELRSKEGFPDIRTLHAGVHPPTGDHRGTMITLRGVTDDDVATAKRYFLRYSGDQLLEETRYGQVLARPSGAPANIYVKGLLVAQEENFLFSYNITSLTKALRQALNRERSNVGRTAYTDRVKAIITECETAAVARPLADDLENYRAGGMHDELSWNDVKLHACRVLASHDKIVFVTAGQLAFGGPQVEYAREEGYRLVLVPDDLAAKIGGLEDLEGRPMLDLDAYREAWNDGFSFEFVDPSDFTAAETRVYALTDEIIDRLGIDPDRIGVREILVSETMRLADSGRMIFGLYDPAAQRIVIRRDRLADPADFCGDLLHELTHAETGFTDGTLDFEDALTQRLGMIMTELLDQSGAAPGPEPQDN